MAVDGGYNEDVQISPEKVNVNSNVAVIYNIK